MKPRVGIAALLACSRKSSAIVAAAVICGWSLTASAQPAGLSMDEVEAVFNFGRARYFHDLVAALPCARFFPDRTAKLNERYDGTVNKLVAQYGEKLIDRTPRPVSEAAVQRSDCSDGGALLGYEDKIVALERLAVKDK